MLDPIQAPTPPSLSTLRGAETAPTPGRRRASALGSVPVVDQVAGPTAADMVDGRDVVVGAVQPLDLLVEGEDGALRVGEGVAGAAAAAHHGAARRRGLGQGRHVARVVGAGGDMRDVAGAAATGVHVRRRAGREGLGEAEGGHIDLD